jgi:hypothetical protein
MMLIQVDKPTSRSNAAGFKSTRDGSSLSGARHFWQFMTPGIQSSSSYVDIHMRSQVTTLGIKLGIKQLYANTRRLHATLQRHLKLPIPFQYYGLMGNER